MNNYNDKRISKYHLYYLSFIFIIILIGILTLFLSSNEGAFSSFSFASTLISIVLAVISIVFSIDSTNKMSASYNNIDGLKKDIEGEVSRFAKVNATSADIESTIDFFIGHDSVKVTELIKNAKQYICFHAAYYPKFGLGEQGEIIKQVLKQKTNLKLSVIFTSTKTSWIYEFAQILRSHYINADLYRDAVKTSKKFFENLCVNFGSNRVVVIESEKLPMFPIIMIDDILIIGFYAHSKFPAPQGLWLKIKNKNVMTMYEKLQIHGNSEAIDFSNCSDEDKAIFRFVEEIFNADAIK